MKFQYIEIYNCSKLFIVISELINQPLISYMTKIVSALKFLLYKYFWLGSVYIFVCRFRVDWRNWTVSKCDFWHIGVTFGTRQQVEVSTQNFSHLDKL